MDVLAAFLLGLTGSLHCVGMCGPLMVAAGGSQAWAGAFAYQAGRLSMYAILGVLLGSLGLGLALWNAQSTVAIVSGLLLIGLALFQFDPGNYLQRQPAYQRFQVRLRAWMSSFIHHGGTKAQIALGCCNGLLPCGLVYLAVIGAAGTENPVEGAIFMLAFGLGTLPLLTATLFAGRRLFRVSAARLATLTPFIMFMAGSLLLYRGWLTYLPAEYENYQDIAFPVMCH